MGFWYLGALRAVEEMAGYLGENEFAALCRGLFENGSNWMDENLFNGEYYIHLVQPPRDFSDIHPGLVIGMGGDDLLNPEYQLGEGCLVDQLAGQYAAHLCGLGYLADPEKIRSTLSSIMKYNYRENLNEHFNCMRSYALGDESALLMADYPQNRPVNPFPYFTEVMTGFEYTAAIGMLFEGMEQEGLQCIRNIRDRYDGFKRNPFDEAEWGHHYGRAMASWSAVPAMTGFLYSAVEGSMKFKDLEGIYFWSNGYRYGTVEIRKSGGTRQVTLETINGTLALNDFSLDGFGQIRFDGGKQLLPGEPAEFTVERNTGS
jgi:non-lysosomal glucosylceramidase